MTPESVMTMGRTAMEVTLMVSAPLLLVALIIGLIVSIFQAATQINEATLSFIPKLVGIFVALGILTRAAPQLNLFGIGFPITLGVGFLTLSLAMPYLGTPILNLFNQGIEAGRAIPRAGATRTPAPAAANPARPAPG